MKTFWSVFDSCVKNDYPEFEEIFSYNLIKDDEYKDEEYITVTPTRLKKSYNFNVAFRTSLNEYYAELKFKDDKFCYFKYMEENKVFLENKLNKELEFSLMNKSASIALKNRYRGYIVSEICYDEYALNLIECIIELDKVAYELERKYQERE